MNSDIPDVLDFVLSVNCMTSDGEVRRISYAAVQENSEPIPHLSGSEKSCCSS